MLMLVLFHAFMGMRIVVGRLHERRRAVASDDRALRPGRGLLLVMGTYVVMTLPTVVPSGMTRR